MRKNISTLLIIINLIASGILIGSPIENKYIPIIIITMFICAIYVFINKNKIKIVRGKIDYIIIALGLTTFIPLLTGKVVSITNEIYGIFQYISAIMLYIIIREYLISYPETKKYITNTIILMSVVLIILGIDNLCGKNFANLMGFIGIEIRQHEPNRLCSVFCYSNALAIVIAISIILNNANYLNQKNKLKKGLYGTVTSFLIIGLLLTYSRLVILVFGIALIIYSIMLKNKEKTLDFLKLLILSTILAYIYSEIFQNLRSSEKYILVWIAMLVINLIQFGIIYFTEGLERKLKDIKIIKVLIPTLSVFVIIIVVVLNTTGSLDVFKNGRKVYEKYLLGVRANEEYTIQHKISYINYEDKQETVSAKNTNFKVEIVEINKFDDEICKTEIPERDFLEEKEIKIKTKENTKAMEIVFTQVNPNFKLIVEELRLNGQNKVLDYKLIPDNLEFKINSTLISQKGIAERKAFIEDGIKIIKDSILTGKGNNAWEYEQYNYQQYYYTAREMHSYIVKIGIEYGITAIICYIIIIALVIGEAIKKIKSKKDLNLEVFLSLLMLIVHSTIDFEMSYLYVLQLFFILIAFMYSYENKQIYEYDKKWTKRIGTLIIVVVTSTFIIAKPIYDSSIKLDKIEQLEEKVNDMKINKRVAYIQMQQEYEDYFNLEQYYNGDGYIYYKYVNVLVNNLSRSNIEETVEKIDDIYYRLKKINPTYDIKTLVKKYTEANKIAEKLETITIKYEKLTELKEKYYNIIIEEYDDVRNSLEENFELYRVTEQNKEAYLDRLTKLKVESEL